MRAALPGQPGAGIDGSSRRAAGRRRRANRPRRRAGGCSLPSRTDSRSQARRGVLGAPTRASLKRPGVVDVHSVDPHSFRAMAARLPEAAAPQIDGRLDDEVWTAAPVFSNFIQREPIVGAPSTERTEFRVLYDDAKLYFAIWAYEPHPGGIVASEMLRDSPLRKGDAVRIVLDTFHDHRNSFYFSTNPLGAQKDGYATENGRMNWDWNAIWEVKTTRDDDGWYSEFAIPLSQIRYRDGAAEQVWGFNVGRIIIHKREETHFVPYPREWQGPGIYRISGAGLLGGLEGLAAAAPAGTGAISRPRRLPELRRRHTDSVEPRVRLRFRGSASRRGSTPT